MAVESTQRSITDGLTERQRELVRENLGLVAVHIRRHLGPPDSLTAGREWQELFQEGCLGLIAAARTYRRRMRMSFAAFALPRIRGAVARALRREERALQAVQTLGKHQAGFRAMPPFDDHIGFVRGVEGHAGYSDRHDPQSAPSEPQLLETVGERLRAKYERAVQFVAKRLATRPLVRGDQDRIVRGLLEGRYLIPSDDCRRPLRTIARDVRCSRARVARCDREVRAAMKAVLSADPEVAALQQIAKRDPMGFAAPIDPSLERELGRSAGIEFASRLRRSGPRRRAAAMGDLLLEADIDLQKWTPRVFQKLQPAARERLLLEPVGRASGSRHRRRRRMRARRRTKVDGRA